ncbi:MAG: DNA mismatch repair protein MutS [Christensenellales bacterium]|jgi:DNA mismatch repair protein MutS
MPLSPMMRQYLQTKEENPGCIVFFRLGDFYEMFFEDAILVSKELELTLTGKECGLEERAPMCGVPYHAADTYVARLIEKGYRVAICEQVSDPALSKGLVDRAVTRIVSPGTIVNAELLDEKRASYILAVSQHRGQCGFAFCDVSTGEMQTYQAPMKDLADELRSISPREIVAADKEGFTAFDVPVTEIGEERFSYAASQKALLAHFSAQSLSELGLEGQRACVMASGALLWYLEETQKNSLAHILRIRYYHKERHMMLDNVASANLELTETIRSKSRKGSLLGVIDRTVTSMGSRQLRAWVERPLQDKAEIEKRLDAVEEFLSAPFRADFLRDSFSGVYDVERLLSKIAYESVNARDCLAILRTLRAIPEIKGQLQMLSAQAVSELLSQMDDMADLKSLLERAISEDAPLQMKDGGIFREGYNETLDTYRAASANGKQWLSDLEARERDKTGIKNLKIGYNRVFGYYIEVTKSYYDLVPKDYVRKQTLANCERFLTDELKKLEDTILGAEDNALRLETELFSEIREILKGDLARLQSLAEALKSLDALLSLAQIAREEEYVRPELNEDGILEIADGRHSVVEKALGREKFVPNDTSLDRARRVMIITGPNMAGKSTYMRQVALIVLMAHVGSFVPALRANIPITDRIFTRIGASDDLYKGQSTFMVEMQELATILKYATEKSLLILDEVGRGTSTFDGLSVAWAAVEHIATKTRALTLFATHYHELSELEGQLDGVANYRITAKEMSDQVVFLRKIVKGSADKSYGIAVASLAGLPASLTNRARQIMARLEVDDIAKGGMGKSILDTRKNAGNRQVDLLDFKPMELIEEIRKLDVMSMSPIEALNELFALNEKARRI